MNLHVSELFIDFIPEYFAEQTYFIVFFLISFDAIDDSLGPFNDQLLKSVPLIKVSIHVLFHRFPSLFVFNALIVMLPFLKVNVIDQIFQLL